MNKITLIAFTLTVSFMLPALGQTSKTVRMKVIETSDVHGHFFPYDFMEKKPLKGTLSRANSYIKKERATYGENLLLIDNGDILQGQPCVYWSNYVMPINENLAASVINYMQYDAETVGNHDIEPGHKVYDKWIREVRCPLLGANIVKAGSDGTAHPKNIYNGLQPYSVHYVDGVKICIIGMLTPAIPNWLTENVWKGLEFEEMTACARKWVKYVKEVERPDLIFGLFHSGKDGGIVTDDYEENATAAVAREVPGFDIIFFGHDHQVHNEWITDKEGRQVLIIDPSCYVKNIAEAEIELTYEKGHLVKKDIRAWIGRIRVSLFVRLGTDNASSTALSCGLLRSVGAILPRTKAYIVPDYHRKCFSLAFHSITAFRLGRLFLTAILLAAASLWQKMSGGARNGNHQRAADKRCDANRA